MKEGIPQIPKQKEQQIDYRTQKEGLRTKLSSLEDGKRRITEDMGRPRLERIERAELERDLAHIRREIGKIRKEIKDLEIEEHRKNNPSIAQKSLEAVRDVAKKGWKVGKETVNMMGEGQFKAMGPQAGQRFLTEEEWLKKKSDIEKGKYRLPEADHEKLKAKFRAAGMSFDVKTLSDPQQLRRAREILKEYERMFPGYAEIVERLKIVNFLLKEKEVTADNAGVKKEPDGSGIVETDVATKGVDLGKTAIFRRPLLRTREEKGGKKRKEGTPLDAGKRIGQRAKEIAQGGLETASHIAKRGWKAGRETIDLMREGDIEKEREVYLVTQHDIKMKEIDDYVVAHPEAKKGESAELDKMWADLRLIQSRLSGKELADVATNKGPEAKKEETLFDAEKGKAEVKKEIEALPKEEREKLGFNLTWLGLSIEQKKNEWFARTFSWIAKTNLDQNKRTTNFCKEHAKSFNEKAEAAYKKALEVKKAREEGKNKHVGSNIASLISNGLKYGTIAASWGVVAPIRIAMMSSMALSAGAETAKRMRFEDEKLIEQTRIQDAERAANEAWEIYKQAGGDPEDQEKNKITAEALKQAYLERMPKDLQDRLKDPGVASGMVQELFKKQLNFSVGRLNNAIEKIYSDKKLTEKQKETEKRKLLKKWEGSLKDYDRVITQAGTIDGLAMGARYAQITGKTVVWVSMLLSAEKLFETIAHSQTAAETYHFWSQAGKNLLHKVTDHDISASHDITSVELMGNIHSEQPDITRVGMGIPKTGHGINVLEQHGTTAHQPTTDSLTSHAKTETIGTKPPMGSTHNEQPDMARVRMGISKTGQRINVLGQHDVPATGVQNTGEIMGPPTPHTGETIGPRTPFTSSGVSQPEVAGAEAPTTPHATHGVVGTGTPEQHVGGSHGIHRIHMDNNTPEHSEGVELGTRLELDAQHRLVIDVSHMGNTGSVHGNIVEHAQDLLKEGQLQARIILPDGSFHELQIDPATGHAIVPDELKQYKFIEIHHGDRVLSTVVGRHVGGGHMGSRILEQQGGGSSTSTPNQLNPIDTSFRPFQANPITGIGDHKLGTHIPFRAGGEALDPSLHHGPHIVPETDPNHNPPPLTPDHPAPHPEDTHGASRIMQSGRSSTQRVGVDFVPDQPYGYGNTGVGSGRPTFPQGVVVNYHSYDRVGNFIGGGYGRAYGFSHDEGMLSAFGNPHGLSDEVLGHVNTVYYSSLHDIWPKDTELIWRNWSSESAEKMMGASMPAGSNMDRLISYLNRVKMETGVEPMGGGLLRRAETLSHYLVRALQEAARQGKLETIERP